MEHLQNLDIFPADDHATFHSTFMDDFFGKLNDECYLIVDNKLRNEILTEAHKMLRTRLSLDGLILL